jgi:hypothetical protein
MRRILSWIADSGMSAATHCHLLIRLAKPPSLIPVRIVTELEPRPQFFKKSIPSAGPLLCWPVMNESDSMVPFLDILVIRKGLALTIKVYRKPTHTGHCLNFESNHPPHVKGGTVPVTNLISIPVWKFFYMDFAYQHGGWQLMGKVGMI